MGKNSHTLQANLTNQWAQKSAPVNVYILATIPCTCRGPIQGNVWEGLRGTAHVLANEINYVISKLNTFQISTQIDDGISGSPFLHR